MSCGIVGYSYRSWRVYSEYARRHYLKSVRDSPCHASHQTASFQRPADSETPAAAASRLVVDKSMGIAGYYASLCLQIYPMALLNYL